MKDVRKSANTLYYDLILNKNTLIPENLKRLKHKKDRQWRKRHSYSTAKKEGQDDADSRFWSLLVII